MRRLLLIGVLLSIGATSSAAQAGIIIDRRYHCGPGVVRTAGLALAWALEQSGDATADVGPYAFGVAATDQPVVGDWDYSATDNAGIVRAVGAFKLWKLDTNNGGTAEMIRVFGRSTDTAVTGRFVEVSAAPVLGVTRAGQGALSAAMLWKLDTGNDGGTAETSIVFGRAGDQPIVGDWDGDGTDNVGVVRTVGALKKAFLDTNGGGVAEIIRTFGRSTDEIVVCDWDRDGIDDLTAVRPGSNALFWAQDTGNDGGIAEQSVSFGRNAGDRPIAGFWIIGL